MGSFVSCYVLRSFRTSSLHLPNGRPRYRVAALLDNDKFGREAIRNARQFDISIMEWKDVFLLLPQMPPTNNRDPNSMKRMLEAANAHYKGLDWEPEDLLPQSFVSAFEQEYGTGIARKTVSNDKVHRDFTPDGKARFHHFIKQHAMHGDMVSVIETLAYATFLPWSFLKRMGLLSSLGVSIGGV